MFVADTGNQAIRKITPTGVVSTLAGSGTQGFLDGIGTAVKFGYPSGVAVDSTGNVFVADTGNNRIRKITPNGVVTTLAGSGTVGFADGTGTTAMFYNLFGVAVDSTGNVYVADAGNNRIRKITPVGVVTTIAIFNFPSGVAVDSTGNVFVADTFNNRICKITPYGVVTTLAGSFNTPKGVAVDSTGNVFVADTENNSIRKITPAGVVTTLAGSSQGFADGTSAMFKKPRGVAVDSTGNVFVADTENNSIRKIYS